jgi:hypothetical protein
MNSDREKNEVEKQLGIPKLYKKRLQVNSVVYPVQKEYKDWNRKAHSSPIKGYRRFSDQENSSKNTKVKSHASHA